MTHPCGRPAMASAAETIRMNDSPDDGTSACKIHPNGFAP